MFDSLYPGDEGKTKARERLFSDASYGCASGLTKHQWVETTKDNPELMYYVSLLGDERILEHFTYAVWFMHQREY